MGKIQHKDVINTFLKIGLFSGSLLITALAVYFYSPTFSSHADTSAPENVDVRLNVNPTIALTTDVSELDLDARLNEFVSGSVNVDVVTNSQYGYTLTLEDADNNTSMVSSESSDVVTSDFSGSKTSSTMEGNTWGYSLDTTNFYKIPANGSSAVIGNTHVPSPSDPGYNRTVVNFGAKVGTALTAGSYEDTVLFTAYVNGQDYNPLPKTLHSISTMQEMTPAVCSATTTPTTAATTFDWDGSHHGDNTYVPRTSLQDTRDGKYYLVSKLADGNCWMSQNLALDLTAGEPIIASNIDGTTTIVTPDTSTQTSPSSQTPWELHDDNWRSYRPSTPDDRDSGGAIISSGVSSNPEAADDWQKVGNYYNRYTALAGVSASSLTFGVDATRSICPQGWRLPSKTGSRSYYGLITEAYGVTQEEPNVGIVPGNSPLNITLPGYFHDNYYLHNQGDEIIDSFGEVGTYWTSTPYDDTDDDYVWTIYTAQFEYFNDELYFSLYDGIGDLGDSIRCVAI